VTPTRVPYDGAHPGDCAVPWSPDESSPLNKPTKTRGELGALIVGAVRNRPDCNDFRSITIRRVVDAPGPNASNWSASGWLYGNAAMDACDATLRRIIPQLQRQYDLAED
jgi:hypothetical protein